MIGGKCGQEMNRIREKQDMREKRGGTCKHCFKISFRPLEK